MGRTLTATFTFVSDIFVHFSLPPCLFAQLSTQSLRQESPAFCQKTGQKNLAKQSQMSPILDEKWWESVHFCLSIHPGSLLVQIQHSAPAPDSIPTAIFHWEHDCYPLADWRGCAKEGERIYAPRRRIGGNQWTRNVSVCDKLVQMHQWALRGSAELGVSFKQLLSNMIFGYDLLALSSLTHTHWIV